MGNLPSALQYYYDDEQQQKLETLILDYQSTSSAGNLDDLCTKIRSLNLTQHVSRLCQSVIKIHHSSKPLDLFSFKILFDTAFTDDEDLFRDDSILISGKNIFRKLLQTVDPFVNPRKYSTEQEWTTHRNVCLVLAIVMEKYFREIELKQFEFVFEYLLKIIGNEFECNVPEAKLYALICIERLLLINFENKSFIQRIKGNYRQNISNVISLMVSEEFITKRFEFNVESVDKLKFVLNKLASYLTEHENIYSINPMQYQISFYADWILRHLFDEWTSKSLEHAALPIVKLSPNRLSVRNCGLNKNYFPTIRSEFYFHFSGVYYFEAIVITDGAMRIGWATNLNEFKEDIKIGVGQVPQSIGFDGSEKCVYYEGERMDFSDEILLPRWTKGDVVGCLIDLDGKKFVFLLNDYPLEIMMKNDINLSTQTYFAACFLYPHQQVYFNFGQKPFKYVNLLGIDVRIQNFHNASEENLQKYLLLEPILTQNLYWFKRNYASAQEMFKDDLQKQFDNWIIEFETKHIKDNFCLLDSETLKILKLIDPLMENYHSIVRIIQSMINHLGNVTTDIKLMHFLENISHVFQVSRKKLPPIGKFLEFLNCHILLSREILQEAEAIRNKRNILIILHLMIVNYSDLKQNNEHGYSESHVSLFKIVIDFLAQTLEKTKDLMTILFGVLCFEHLAMQPCIREKMLWKRQVVNSLTKQFDTFHQIFKKLDYSKNIFECNVCFCVRWCIQNVFDAHLGLIEQRRNILNNIKISNRNAAFRNDYIKPNFLTSEYKLHHNVCYYEIIPLTQGVIKFGWSFEKPNESNETIQLETILFDAYSKCILLNRSEHSFESLGISEKIPWNAGDTFGCLVDCLNEKFAFYLNGEIILEYKPANFDYKQPYYYALYIGTYNQLYMNCRPYSYKYPPKDIEFENIREREIYYATSPPPLVPIKSEMIRNILNKYQNEIS